MCQTNKEFEVNVKERNPKKHRTESINLTKVTRTQNTDKGKAHRRNDGNTET